MLEDLGSNAAGDEEREPPHALRALIKVNRYYWN